MTELDRASRPSGSPRSRKAIDLRFFRHELEQQRQFRRDQLTSLAYEAIATADEARAEVIATLKTAARAVLSEIDAALFRLAIGSFGSCERCGAPISEDRLRVLPAASLCLRCEYAEELNGGPPESRRSTISGSQLPCQASEARPERERPTTDIVELWGLGSFPASDPPANW